MARKPRSMCRSRRISAPWRPSTATAATTMSMIFTAATSTITPPTSTTTNSAAPTHEPATNTQPPSRKTRFTDKEKRKINFTFVCNYTKEKGLKQETIKKIAAEFGVSRNTIGTIWSKSKVDVKEGREPDSKPKFKGTKPRLFLDLEILRTLPQMERTNIIDLALALKTSASTAYRLVQRGKIRSCSSALKPYLSDDNKLARMQWVLSKINPLTRHSLRPSFDTHYCVIHIDEKWFYMTRLLQKVYLLKGEEEPHRSCKSKRYITQIMFMAAVARPIFDSEGNVVFDGKIGIWPFTVKIVARKSSTNRPKGTMEEKPIESINTEVTRAIIIEKILPAIKAKRPQGYGRRIVIQQDNAKPHIRNDDPEFRKAAKEGGWDIILQNQPPNSPDMNALHLGFFRVIQEIQYKKKPNTVTKAYNETKVKTLQYVFLSLMNCYKEVLKKQGNNSYKLPHMGKKKQDRLGMLPEKIRIDQELLVESIQEVEHQKAVKRGKEEAAAAKKVAEAQATAAKKAVKASAAAIAKALKVAEAAKAKATAKAAKIEVARAAREKATEAAKLVKAQTIQAAKTAKAQAAQQAKGKKRAASATSPAVDPTRAGKLKVRPQATTMQ